MMVMPLVSLPAGGGEGLDGKIVPGFVAWFGLELERLIVGRQE